MDRPVHLVAALVAMLGVADAASAADEAVAAPKRQRVISTHVADILAAAAPKYEPPATAANGSAESASGDPNAARPRLTDPEITLPANTIIRLPEYLVRERKPKPLPKPEEVLVPGELGKRAMWEFLGDERGVERGFLNLFTVADLWKKIPILGQIRLEGFETNEDKAIRMYRADRKAKAWAEAMGLLTPAERAAISSPTGSAPPKK